MPQLLSGRMLVGAIVAALVGVAGYIASPVLGPEADMYLEPQNGIATRDTTFRVTVMVQSDTPVNVFAGEVLFDPALLTVDTIDYNTSVADLWAERPWYSNGEGTLNFIGGTTRAGGFTGSSELITITFKTKQTGDAVIALKEARILKHDGLGTDAVLAEPIDALFVVETNEPIDQSQTVLAKSTIGGGVRVVEMAPSTDLNGDGKQNFADMSIFLTHFASGNLRSDFNQDGRVSMADMSIILDAQ